MTIHVAARDKKERVGHGHEDRLRAALFPPSAKRVAVMHSAGIQMDEAVFLLGENMEDAAFKRACDDVYKELIVGKPLALAMDDSGCFPLPRRRHGGRMASTRAA